MVWMGVRCTCPPIHDVIVSPYHLFLVADTRLHLAMSVGLSVGRSVRHNSESQAVFVLPLRLFCRASGLVL